MHQALIKNLVITGALALACASTAQKKPLDHSVYDGWKSVQGTQLTDDGKWLMYRIVPQEGDAVVEIKSTDGTKTHIIERGSTVSFSGDGKYVVAIVQPTFIETRDARRKKAKPEDMPKNSVTFLNLETGQKNTYQRVTTFMVAEEDKGWVVYKPEPPKPTPPTPAAKPPEGAAKPAAEQEKPKKKSDHRAGEPIVVRHLASGKEERIEDVGQYRFSRDGNTLVYTVSTKDGSGDGIVWLDLASGKRTQVVTQLGRYPRFAIDHNATLLAFSTDKDDYSAEKPSHSIYVFDPKTGKATLVAKQGTPGIPDGWWIPDSSNLAFSEDAKRLIFTTTPKPAEEKKDEIPDEEKAVVDVWHYKDPTLQPQQLLTATADRNRTYTAVAHLTDGNKVVQLATPEMPSVSLGSKSQSPVALASTNLPYRIEMHWDTGYEDVYVVDVQTGQARRVVTHTEGNFRLSPTGKYVYGYDPATKTALAIDSKTGTSVNIGRGIPFPIWNEYNDVPGNAGEYGFAGWTKDDDRVLVYDFYDIWSVDPTGKAVPVNVTNGAGRNGNIHLRYVRTDPEEEFIDTTKPMLLAAMNETTKADGFYWDRFGAGQYPTRILMKDKALSAPTKAKNADTIFFTQQDFTEYPDVWLADNLDFQNPRRVSTANPQQSQYNWGTSELISYTTNDGVPLQGILIRPEDFDAAKTYPMIVYFYERNADTLHAYRSPAPTASILNPIMAASQGYLVLIPDIVYKDGYPGESAMSSIMPAVQEVVRRGYVDPKRIGIDGQSWGGYQTAYLITETDMFACAYSGAPVVNMFSAYGGIRWGSGLVRAFQYEKGQSRIGGSIWDETLRFIENSPMFFLDKVKTPVLIMHNDKDGSVPWYQGIEMFTDLRRLQKPAWLLVYNGDDHNLIQRKNRVDLSIRKQQFYDHYLKGAPMPEWMRVGVPATAKGKNFGLEIGGKG